MRIMLQRWIKNIFVFTAATVFFASCTEKTFSPDLPLEEEFTPSVYVGSQNQFLLALNPNTGEKKWELDLETNLKSTPLVLGDRLVVSTDRGLMVIDPNNGTLLKVYNNVISTESSPTGAGDMVYVGTDVGDLVAVNIATENIDWQFNTTGPVNSSPILHNGILYFASTQTVYALDVVSVTNNWQFAPAGGATFYSSPTINEPYVYIGCDDGNLYALNMQDGSVGWQYSTPEPIKSSPIVYGGNIIFGSNDNKIYCIDSGARTPRWVYETRERVVSSPYGYNQVVYVGSYDYNFYAINIIDGTLKWKYNMNALVKSSPLVHDGTVYVGGFDKFVYAFDTSGILRWSNRINGAIETSPVLYDLEEGHYPAISGLSVD